MKVNNINFKMQYKKCYSIQTKDGKSVDKDYADKRVKRNMKIFNIGIVPASVSAIGCIFAALKKQSPLGALGIGALLGIYNAVQFKNEYDYYKSQKDYQPQKFYKWGGFKVV